MHPPVRFLPGRPFGLLLLVLLAVGYAFTARAGSVQITGSGNSLNAHGHVALMLRVDDNATFYSALDLGGASLALYSYWEADWGDDARNGWAGFIFPDPTLKGHAFTFRDGPNWSEFNGMGGEVGAPNSGAAFLSELTLMEFSSLYGTRSLLFHFESNIDWQWDGSNLSGIGTWRYWLTNEDGTPVPDYASTIALAGTAIALFGYGAWTQRRLGRGRSDRHDEPRT
jgi:hypothetical protein